MTNEVYFKLDVICTYSTRMPQPGDKIPRSPPKRRVDDQSNSRPYNLRAKPLNFDSTPFKTGDMVEIFRGASKKFIDKVGTITKITKKKVWILCQDNCNYPTEITNIRSYQGNKIISKYIDLSRGVLPENLRRGPYAVVDERCEDVTLDPK